MIKSDSKFPGKTIMVNLGARSYPIYVGSDSLGMFGELFLGHCRGQGGGEKSQGRAVIITDENVGPLYGQAVEESLSKCGVETHMITVKAGEKSKCRAKVEMIYEKLFDFSIERSDAIIALGGGVAGDLSGFAAATFKRGVSYVQFPTSLLAMVDSSIGGKTGINHARGKNMIGSFYQPKMVWADTATLKTLPKRELGCGLAETVKHAVIRDKEFFEHLETNSESILELDMNLMVDLVVRNCRIKAGVVAADEQESNLRGILNLGHTIGHTIETVLAEKDIHHGEAVALGMVGAARLAVKRGLLKKEEAGRIAALLEAFKLPTKADTPLPADELYTAMKQDKKVRAGKIRFVLPTSIGSCTFVDNLSEEEIKEVMRSL